MNYNPLFTFFAVVWLASAGCDSRIYVRDGVTDGDTFYLAPRAYEDDDPVLQSWVSYSLTRSACQLATGGDNPARVSSYECEHLARSHLLETWAERRSHGTGHADDYLDTLLSVQSAGFLDEYTVHYFRDDSWQTPVNLEVERFQAWRREHLRGHRPQTHIIGSWGYAPGMLPPSTAR